MQFIFTIRRTIKNTHYIYRKTWEFCDLPIYYWMKFILLMKSDLSLYLFQKLCSNVYRRIVRTTLFFNPEAHILRSHRKQETALLETMPHSILWLTYLFGLLSYIYLIVYFLRRHWKISRLKAHRTFSD